MTIALVEPIFHAGDIVTPKKGVEFSGTNMTVEGYDRHVSSTMVFCIWFDESNKLRKLRFYEWQLDLVARSAGSMKK